jgi:hypothetical protein
VWYFPIIPCLKRLFANEKQHGWWGGMPKSSWMMESSNT